MPESVRRAPFMRPCRNELTPKKITLNIMAAVGLALGAVFGMAGTMVAQPTLQAALWAIDSVGLVMAAALLTLKFFRKGNDLVAAGFLVFAIGEGVMFSGTAAGPAGSVPSFAAGTALWAAALLLISVPKEFAIGICLVGILASILFAITFARIFGVSRCCDVIAAAVLCVPLPRHYFRGLDLDPAQRTDRLEDRSFLLGAL